MKNIKIYKKSKAKTNDVDYVKLAKLQSLEHALCGAAEDLLHWKKIMCIDIYEAEEKNIKKLNKKISEIYDSLNIVEYFEHKIYNIFEIPGDGAEDMIGVELKP